MKPVADVADRPRYPGAAMIHPFELNWRHLRGVVELAARGRLTAAANAVSLSQPALTQGLAKLERQIGVPLFDRFPDGMRPTRSGSDLVARVERAFGHLAAANRAAGRGFARPDRLVTGSQFRALLALADAGGFASGARSAGLSQPALHRAVRDLEDLFATRLAVRTGRGTSLTPAGARLTRAVRLAVREVAAGIAEARGDDDDFRVVVGAMPLCRALVLPKAIASFAAELPASTIDVVEGSWRELSAGLADGRLDLMVGALRDPGPEGFEQRPLFDDLLAVIGRAGHPLASSTEVGVESLRRCRWIVGQPGTPLRVHWDALFAHGSAPSAPIECGSVMVTRGILLQTDFLTLLSPDQVAMELQTGALVRIGPPLVGARRTIGVTTRRGWLATPSQTAFLRLLAEAAAHTRNSQNE